MTESSGRGSLPCVEPDCVNPRLGTSFYCEDHISAGDLTSMRTASQSTVGRDVIAVLLVLGFLLAFLGAAIAVMQHPTLTLDEGGNLQSQGSDVDFALGLSLLGVGYALAMTGIVAVGVMLGRRASRE
jgi:hypothetical protein